MKDLGWSYERIAQNLHLPSSTVYNWVTNRNSPYGSYTTPDLQPSPALSYIAGAFLGDGGLIKSSSFHYELRLRVKDYDFADRVAACLSKIIQKPKQARLDRRKFFLVRIWSRLLFEYLSDWDSIRETSEHFPADFIRGFADAEGTPAVSVYTNSKSHFRKLSFYIVLVNTDKALLEYIAHLLRTKFEISSNIFLERKRIRMWSKLPCYRLTLNRRADQRRFSTSIGFQMKRKNQKMLDALHLLDSYEPRRAAFEWERLYEKRGRNWVRRNQAATAGDGAPGGI